MEAQGEGDPYHAPDDDWRAVAEARREYFRSDDDHDGLTLIEERRHGTNPADADSDHDGVSDFDEAFSASNPLNARSRPADSRGIRGTEDMVEAALGSVGARYQLGAEASERNLDPRAFDSSELVEWSAARAGVNLPDGSWRQYQALHRAGGATSIETALATRGALLFHFDTDPLTSRSRPGGASVVISLGDGRVVHASSKAGEVIVANAADYNFTHAAVVTELNDYDDPIDSPTGTATADDTVISIMPVTDPPADDTVMSIMPVADSPADDTVISIMPVADPPADDTVMSIMPVADSPADDSVMSIMPVGDPPPLATEAPLPAPPLDVGDLVLGSMEDVEASLPPDTASFLRDIGAIPTSAAAPQRAVRRADRGGAPDGAGRGAR